MFIYTRRKRKKGIRRKRSSYGTDMMNLMETKVSSHSTNEQSKLIDKIKLLIQKQPGFKLYESWLEKAQGGQITQREVDTIQLHYYNL